jgi:P27 family predicted phage terminase small subunit
VHSPVEKILFLKSGFFMSRPKPPDLRLGNNGTTPVLVRSEPVPTPDPPSLFGEFGKTLWAELWQLGSGVYQAGDYGALERYVSMQERRNQLLEVLKVDGLLSRGSTGQLTAHPAAKMVNDIESKLLNLESALALTPESRMRMGLAAIETKSRLDQFLDGG